MLAFLVTGSGLVKGIVNGSIIALVAMAIVVVYRSTRVINFSAGAIGLPATALLGYMVSRVGLPYWPSLLVCLLIATLTGAIFESLILRRLSKSPRVIVFVATIGLAQIAQLIYLYVPGYKTGTASSAYPIPFTSQLHITHSIEISANQIFTLLIVAAVAGVLWWLLGHTAFGESVSAAATNADLARMTAISPKLVNTAIWAIAGMLSALVLMLTATLQGAADISAVGPVLLLKGLAAALLGRMRSFPKAVAGGIAIGVGFQLFYQNLTDGSVANFVVFILVALLVARNSRDGEAGGESFQFAPRVSTIPAHLKQLWWIRLAPSIVGALALVAAIVLPLTTKLSERHLLWSSILGFALCAISVVILTGWGGQLSLGQMAFAGIGALSAAAAGRGFSLNIGWHSTRFIRGRLQPIAFPWSLLIGAAIACAVATLVGLGALRVRGLLLAATTIAFAIAAEEYLFGRPFFLGDQSTATITRADIGPFKMVGNNRGYFYFSLACLVVTLLVVGRLKRTGIGRAIVGVRENEHAASAMTVSPTRVKLTAFALAGFVAGLGGAILGAVNPTFSPTKYFHVTDSLTLIAMTVIGGVASLSGAVLGALWVVGLPAFWPTNKTVPLFTSGIGMLIMLLYFPGGFTQIGFYTRDSFLRWLETKIPAKESVSSVVPPAAITRDRTVTPTFNDGGSALAVRDLSVRFGGNVALNNVSMLAMPGEVVGLIGTNGAGKSTLLNAIGGFVDSEGTIEMLGKRIDGFAAFRRAKLGLGRTFQAATLFPELTVAQTIALALESQRRTGFWSSALCTPSSIKLERKRVSEAQEFIDFLGLTRYAERYIVELSTGTRRIVELTAMLAVRPRVICLDEPTAGVAQREAEAFGPLIQRVQRELDATVIIVEHDMPMIMAISDRIYCMEAGAVIAQGTSAEVRNNPLVIASYLGTDARSIDRSDSR